ncbi:hypothetical protein [Arthrobacter sp. zg-Y1143]|uniref:hypothetical protein n=1 Tax=Arthrobacter sp. zg-Y1143 TaxID=3049065 RepID=UPI0024C4243E|nr:hypothetical protein [Arthrobacter sp. zg-Y1143]MDK1327292.1 hypothetical protein [Arthrobacter sp. zg-Y1143]
MRNKFAVPLIVLGVLLMLVGIGQRTIWAPPETESASAAVSDAKAPVTVLDAELLAGYPDGVEITVRQDAPFTLAVGRANDVEAWVGEAAANRLEAADGDELAAASEQGEAKTPNPAGSDLWVVEEAGEGELSYDWKAPTEGDWEILLATDGTAAAPGDVTLTWDSDASRPLAVPLIVLGALLAVLGLALGFLRSGDTPRRGGRRSAGPDNRSVPAEKSPSSTSAFTAHAPARRRPAMAAAAAAALVLVATPAPALAEEGSAGSRPVVLDSQLERILADVAGTVEAGDAAKDANALAPRVGGSAYALREANYAVAAKAADHEAPVPVAAQTLRTQSVAATDSWPRTIVAVTQGEANPVPQALLLVQASARENYKLVSAVQMLPASTFPQPPAAGTGADQIPADSANGLLMSPQQAVAALADSLTNPQGDNKATFAGNRFTEDVVKFQEQVKTDPKNEFATNTFTHTAEPSATHALRTADGGAIVFGYLANTFSSTPKEAGDSINLEGTVYQSLTGEANTGAGIDVRHGEAVMVYVPAAGSNSQAQVVGAAQQLLGATLK